MANSILIISDIHANLSALQATLTDFRAEAGEPVAIWCMGDIVDYGAEPNEVIALLQEYPTICVAGNHEMAARGEEEVAMFNPEARKSVLWTQQHLSEVSINYLRKLPKIVTLDSDDADFTLVHGSLRDPMWEYVLDNEVAADQFVLLETRHGLIGHSHLPIYFRLVQLDRKHAGVRREEGSHNHVVPVGGYKDSERLLLNPGGLGQPRDGDPRACYVIYDQDHRTMRYRRVAYDIKAAQAKIRAAGLPERFAKRLERGA